MILCQSTIRIQNVVASSQQFICVLGDSLPEGLLLFKNVSPSVVISCEIDCKKLFVLLWVLPPFSTSSGELLIGGKEDSG